MVGDLVPLGAVIASMALLVTAIASVGVVVALTALGKTGIVHWGIVIAIVVLVLALILGTFSCFLFVFMIFGVMFVVAKEIHDRLDGFGVPILSERHLGDETSKRVPYLD